MTKFGRIWTNRDFNYLKGIFIWINITYESINREINTLLDLMWWNMKTFEVEHRPLNKKILELIIEIKL